MIRYIGPAEKNETPTIDPIKIGHCKPIDSDFLTIACCAMRPDGEIVYPNSVCDSRGNVFVPPPDGCSR